jgi:hypothetical protein
VEFAGKFEFDSLSLGDMTAFLETRSVLYKRRKIKLKSKFCETRSVRLKSKGRCYALELG